MDIAKAKEQAYKEIDEEKFREEVERQKMFIKNKKGFWDFIPYRITITKKERKNG